ncbi:hypothetical protein GCM10028802_41530 [Terrabacter terrigena]
MAEAKPRAAWTDDMTPPRRDLVDDQLLEEIELLAEVITQAAGHPGPLSQDEVDAVLGLSPPWRGPHPSPSGRRGLLPYAVDLSEAQSHGTPTAGIVRTST